MPLLRNNTTTLYAILNFGITTRTTGLNYSATIAPLPCWRARCDTRQYLPLAPTTLQSARSLSHLHRPQKHKQSIWISTAYSLPSFSCLTLSCRVSSQRHYSVMYQRLRKVTDAPAGVFRGHVDRFNGITVRSDEEYEPNEDFVKKLEKSLEYWSTLKRRGIWFKINLAHADWVPHLAKFCFDFHHAKAGFVQMFRWLPTNEVSGAPTYAHTLIAVGCLVVNEQQQVLVVTDRHALIPNSWKLPGGYIEPREDIVSAAVREVREETGVHCEFNTVVSIRHSHGGNFDCSDVYIVIALTPKTQQLTRCEREIERLQWMPIEEFLQHPNVHEGNRHFMRTYLDYKQRDITITRTQAIHEVLKKEYSLIYVEPKADALKEN